MVYKKYIKRDGKTYGPYLYKSIKKDGKVITEYIGHSYEKKTESKISDFHGVAKKSNRKFWIVSGFLSIVCIVLLIYVFFLLQFGATGKAFAEIQETYYSGEQITGQVNLILKQGELFPADSKLIVDNSGEIQEYNLKDFLNQEYAEGNFFIENTEINGSGNGYGVPGEKTIYPNVTFSFRVISLEKGSENATSVETGNETTPITNETISSNETGDVLEQNVSGGENGGEDEVTEPTPEEPITPSTETPQETPTIPNTETETSTDIESSSTSTESIPSPSDSGGITGGVITGEIIKGEVSKDKSFEYQLNLDETIEIIDSSQPVKFKIENGKAVVTTDYFEIEKGFGLEYLSEQTTSFPVSLSDLGIVAKEGKLKISFVYNDLEITSVAKNIVIKKLENETILNESNLTRGEKIQLVLSQKRLNIESNVVSKLIQDGKVRVIIKTKKGAKSIGKELSNLPGFEVVELDEFNIELLDSLFVEKIVIDERVSLMIEDSERIIRSAEVRNEYGLTGNGKKICILDTGLDFSVVPYSIGYDFVNNDDDSSDDNGHGTEVAYIAKSIAPEADIIPVKVIDSSGNGYESDVLQGLQYCINQNVDVISFSIGSGSYDGYCDSNVVAELANQAVDNGIFVVTATGNDGSTSLKSPSCASKVVRVSATDKQDQIADFANVNEAVDLFAPGVGIETKGIGGGSVTLSGTSASAPMVSAGAVIVLQNEILSPYELKTRFKTTGFPIAYNEINISRIDVYNAVINNVTMGLTNATLNQTNVTIENYTILVSEVNLISPVNDYSFGFGITPLSCSAEASLDLTNLSLYGNWSGGWHLNQTTFFVKQELNNLTLVTSDTGNYPGFISGYAIDNIDNSDWSYWYDDNDVEDNEYWQVNFTDGNHSLNLINISWRNCEGGKDSNVSLQYTTESNPWTTLTTIVFLDNSDYKLANCRGYPNNYKRSYSFPGITADKIRILKRNQTSFGGMMGFYEVDIFESIYDVNSTYSVNNLSAGYYKWNCLASDVQNDFSFAPSNRTFIVDPCLPSTSGDWLVTGNCNIINYVQTTPTKGRTYIAPGALLTITNSTLILNETIVQYQGTMKVINSPNTIWQNGNLTINGKYSLINSTLRMNGTSSNNGSIGILVNNTGIMEIYNNSNITNGQDSNYRYFFIVNSGSSFSMNYSSLSYAGWSSIDGKKGLELSTTVNNFKGNSLDHNYEMYLSSSNNVIENNTFNNTDLKMPTDDPIYLNNTFIGNNFDFCGIIISGNNHKIFNNSINSTYTCIYLVSVSNSQINFNNISNCIEGIKGYAYPDYLENNTFSGNILEYNRYGFLVSLFAGFANSYFYNNIIRNNSESGINIRVSTNNTFQDCVFANSTNYDLILLTHSINNTFLNTTFNKNKVSIDLDSNILVKWYLDVLVGSEGVDPISNANVSAYNKSGALIFSQLTNSSGFISRKNITEYYRNYTGTYPSTNYTINVNNTGFENVSFQLNITNSTFLVVKVNNLFPLISFVSPTELNNTLLNRKWTYVNVSINESHLKEAGFNWNGTNYSLYDSSLVLMMNFDNVSALGENNSVISDLSGNGNNGTNRNNNLNWGATFGKYNGAYNFSGSGWINIKKSNSLNNTNALTVAVWIKPTISSGLILSNYRDANLLIEPGVFVLNLSDSKINCIVDDYSQSITSTTSLSNQWYYVTISINNSYMLLYINGVEDAAPISINTAPFLNNSGAFVVGAGPGGASPIFQGIIDELRIYNRTLNASEVQELYYSNLYKYSPDKWMLGVNQSVTQIGNYTYYAYAKDIVNNFNKTETRTITLDPCTLNGVTDWNLSDSCVFINKNINMTSDKNINIFYGGNLTLVNSTLRMRPSGNGTSNIAIFSGGLLNLTGNSLITSNNSLNRYAFIANSGSSLYLTNSTVEYTGWSANGGQRGLEVSSTNTIFNRSTFRYNYHGLVLLSNLNILENNTFTNNTENGLLIEGKNNTIFKNNFIKNNNRAILTTSSAGGTNITRNIFYDNPWGISFSSPNSIIEGNIINGTGIGQGKWGLTLWASNVSVLNNEISNLGVCVEFAFSGGGISVIKDSRLINCSAFDVKSSGIVGGHKLVLLNTSFNRSKFNFLVDSSGNIEVQWYLDVNVTNKTNPLSGTNVSAWNVSGGQTFSQLTNALGFITRQNVTDYIQNQTLIISSNNYTLNANKSGYGVYFGKLNITNNTQLNISLNRLPVVSNIVLNSSSGRNFSSDNLSVYFSKFDSDGDIVDVITNWFVNSSSLFVLNLPFNTQVNGNNVSIKDYSSFENAVSLGNSTYGTAPTWNASGRVGGAYVFDGVNDFITCGNNPVLNINKSMTIEVWIKPAMVSENGNNYGVMAKALNPGWSWQLRFGGLSEGAATDRLGFQFNNGSVPGAWVNVDANLIVGQWYHVVGTYDSTVPKAANFAIYLNGIKKDQNFIDNYFDNVSVPILIGNEGRPGNFFNGTIDEVRIYNRSLSAEQVYQNYLAGLANKSIENISSQETSFGDVWNVDLTPNDAKHDGIIVRSNNLTIQAPIPLTTKIILNSTLGTNKTLEDLQCFVNISDEDNTFVYANYTWYNDTVPFLSGRAGPFPRDNLTLISVLGNGNTTKGERWNCSVKAYNGDVYENAWNNATILILNSLPIVNLTAPEDNNYTYNRTPTLYWNASDDDNDSLSFDINFEAYGGCDTTRSYGSSRLNYTFFKPLVGLIDKECYYNWSVRGYDFNDESIWGDFSSVRRINIQALVSINLLERSISFGSLMPNSTSISLPGESNDTVDRNPRPFVLENNGNCITNVSVNATNLWTVASPNPSQYFRYKIDDYSGEVGSFNKALSKVGWTNVPNSTDPQLGIAFFNWTDVNDTAEIDILVQVPPYPTSPPFEPGGNKVSFVSFNANLTE